MSSMPWSTGPSTHPVSRLPPRGPQVTSDRLGRGAAVTDGAERTGGAESLGRAHQEIAALKARLAIEQIHCREALAHGTDFEDMVGRTPAMLRLHDQIAQVAVTDSTVLVTGETGTGKELVARAVHSRSRRRRGPLVAVNCGALSPTLVESGFRSGTSAAPSQARPRCASAVSSSRTVAPSSSTRWESCPKRCR